MSDQVISLNNYVANRLAQASKKPMWGLSSTEARCRRYAEQINRYIQTHGALPSRHINPARPLGDHYAEPGVLT